MERLIQSCSNLEMQFQPPKENNVLDALKPLQHKKRAEAILEVSKQLDDLKVSLIEAPSVLIRLVTSTIASREGSRRKVEGCDEEGL